jgi:hypothetical protein
MPGDDINAMQDLYISRLADAFMRLVDADIGFGVFETVGRAMWLLLLRDDGAVPAPVHVSHNS